MTDKLKSMKYRKKPVVVDAYQTNKEVIIHTLEGDMKADVGDYIITGVKGEQYPCKPDIFEQTYEKVMPDNEIKKDLQAAMEWFAEHGRNTNTAIIGICERALDLINRQQAENEQLKKSNRNWRRKVQRLRKIKAEAYKEFAERCREVAFDRLYVSIPEIDNILNEFTKG